MTAQYDPNRYGVNNNGETKRKLTDEELEVVLKKIQENARSLGYYHETTPEEKYRMARANARSKFFEKIFGAILSALRTIIYTPLSIAFHVISIVSRIIGGVSSVGLLLGAYDVYQGVRELMNGVPFSEIAMFGKAVPFIVTPFAAYAVAVITEHIYLYFENNNF